MSQPSVQLPGGGAPLAPRSRVPSERAPAATPSKLTGTKLLLIILGIIAACGIMLVGVIALAAALGWKLFEAVR